MTEQKLVSAFLKRINKLNYFCTAENVSPNLTVHETRKIFKRMRAYLKFFSHSSNPVFKHHKKDIVRLGKSLSGLRESFVDIQLFERLTNENSLIAERKLKAIKDKLVERNHELIRSDFVDSEITVAIHENMNNLAANISAFENEYPNKEQLINTLCKSYKKCHSFYKKNSSYKNAEELHELRKKIKVLYYQMDVLKFVNPKFFKAKATQLHAVTEQLGNDHDLYVFLNDLKQLKYDFEETELQVLSKQIEHLREVNIQKLDTRLNHLFSDPTEIFNQKISEVFNA